MAAEAADDRPSTKFNATVLRRALEFARPYRRSFVLSVVLLLALAASSLLVPLVIRHTHRPRPPGLGRGDAVGRARRGPRGDREGRRRPARYSA